MRSLTPTQITVIEALASGSSVTAAADAAGVHRTTVHHWCRTIPAFRHTIEAAKQARIDAVRDRMNELAAPSLAILRNIIHDESAPLALRMRTAMAVLKFVSTPEKTATPKQASTEMLFDAAYEAGVNAALQSVAGKSENEIHHNSSLSSNDESDERQTPRNALCPCGSKLKYKRCCGKSAPPVLGKAA